MTITDTPQMTILQTGKSFKVLQVTGSEGMTMPQHISTKEAVVTVQKGSAMLKINGNEHLLTQHQSFVIPAGEPHSLTIKENFQAVAVMATDSEIKFVQS